MKFRKLLYIVQLILKLFKMTIKNLFSYNNETKYITAILPNDITIEEKSAAFLGLAIGMQKLRERGLDEEKGIVSGNVQGENKSFEFKIIKANFQIAVYIEGKMWFTYYNDNSKIIEDFLHNPSNEKYDKI